MNELAAARDQLEQAITRLEKAISERDAAAGTVPANGAGAATEELNEALAASRLDYSRLREATETVSLRIDGIIERLRGALGDGRTESRG